MNARRLARFALPIVAVAFFATMATSAFATPFAINVTAVGKTFAVPVSLVSSPSVIDTAGVGSWVTKTVAAGVHRDRRNASVKVDTKKKKLVFTGSLTEYKMYAPQQAALANMIIAAIPSALTTTSVTTIPFDGLVSVRKPVIAKLNKTILVVKSERRIYLFNNTKVEKTYRCAIGQPAWPTPSGTFYIGKKNPHPTWTNGYASWSKNMPSFIGPGPNNPLGTRALYVYSKKGGDTGVRFHGVPPSENSSIGHAASHGCLRMLRKNVEDFYPRVPLKTTVFIIK
jgi:lipoprotein-anchoring transpeptidase ErfK/SrfK